MKKKGRGHGPVPFLFGRQLDLFQLHVGEAEDFLQSVELIRTLVENALDSRVDQHLEAVNAGRVRNVGAPGEGRRAGP